MGENFGSSLYANLDVDMLNDDKGGDLGEYLPDLGQTCAGTELTV